MRLMQTDTNKRALSEQEFNKKYWFSSTQLITVKNLFEEPVEFMVEGRNFKIDAKSEESFTGNVANVYLDQMSRILAQNNDDRLGDIADPQLRKQYYDKLIVEIKELNPAYTNSPKTIYNSPSISRNKESAPWEIASDVASGSKESDQQEEPSVPIVDKIINRTKSFTYNGNQYRMVIDKNGNAMYYMNGRRTSEAEYARAASM